MTSPQYRALQRFADALRAPVSEARRFSTYLAAVTYQESLPATHAALRAAFDTSFALTISPLITAATSVPVYDTDRLCPSPSVDCDVVDTPLRDVQWERTQWRSAPETIRASRREWLERYFAHNRRTVALRLDAPGLATDKEFWWWLVSRAHPVLVVPRSTVDWHAWVASTVEPGFLENPGSGMSKSALQAARRSAEDGVAIAVILDRIAEAISAQVIATADVAVELFEAGVATATYRPNSVARAL